MSLGVAVRGVLVVVVVLLIQTTIGVDITIAGAHPDFMLLLPVAAGMAGDAEEAAIVGFVAGMAADLLLPTPLGLSALVGCLVGFAVGYGTGAVVREVWWFRPLVALLSSGAGVLLYAVLGAVLNQQQFVHVDLAAVVTVVAVCNAVLAVPAVRVMRWVLQIPDGSRAEGGRTSLVGGRL